jgi:hypothetical protein
MLSESCLVQAIKSTFDTMDYDEEDPMDEVTSNSDNGTDSNTDDEVWHSSPQNLTTALHQFIGSDDDPLPLTPHPPSWIPPDNKGGKHPPSPIVPDNEDNEHPPPPIIPDNEATNVHLRKSYSVKMMSVGLLSWALS